MRKIIIGDIHGCARSMEALLQKIDFDKTLDRMIFLGDYLDRGNGSFEVFREIVELKHTMGQRCVLLLGNHDWFFLNAQNPEVFEIWEENGFRATRASFICYDIELRFDNTERRKCISWLRDNLQPYYIGENFQCAHAGIEKEWINENSQETLIWDRDSAGVYQGRLTIVGHTPLRAPTYYPGNGTVRELPYDTELPLPKIGIINIDTGCVFERKLTAMIVEGGSFKLVGTEYNA